MTPSGKWFSAVLLLESLVDDDESKQADREGKEQLFEERIIVMNSSTEHEALVRAAEIGKAAEHSYQNKWGHAVRWVFREVLELKELYDAELKDGTEVYSRLLGASEASQRRSGSEHVP